MDVILLYVVVLHHAKRNLRNVRSGVCCTRCSSLYVVSVLGHGVD
jgi:hypothetical protein